MHYITWQDILGHSFAKVFQASEIGKVLELTKDLKARNIDFTHFFEE